MKIKTITSLCFFFTSLCSSVYSQNYKCDINAEFKEGYKLLTTNGRVLYNNDSGFVLVGYMLGVYNAEDSLTSIDLTYEINTTAMEAVTRGLLRVSNSFKENAQVGFIFQNTDGGTSKISLDIAKRFDVNPSNDFVHHTCRISIPKEALKSFRKKKVIGISVPYYDEYFNVKTAFPTIFIDYYKCFLRN